MVDEVLRSPRGLFEHALHVGYQVVGINSISEVADIGYLGKYMMGLAYAIAI